MIPEGTYAAKVVSAELCKSGTGKEQIAVTFNIEGNGSITWFGFFTPKTIDRTIESMEYCGFTGDDITKLDSMLGGEAQIVVEHETYEGKTRARVQWVNSNDGPRLNQMDAAEELDFATKMKGELLARKQFKSKRDADNEDVPFKV